MVRQAIIEDLPAIVDIYNQAIDAGFKTAFTEHLTVADRVGWFNEHAETTYPLYVYLVDGNIAGWLSISPYRQGRAALGFSVEVSYFIHSGYQRMGIGTQLLQHAVTHCTAIGYRAMLAIIIDRNEASIKLAEKAGFEKWGYLPHIADFGGVLCGHVYYGKLLTEPDLSANY